MIRYLIALNVLALYIIYVGGKLDPHPLTPLQGGFDYFGVVIAGVNVLVACAAILRWKALDRW